MIGAVAAWALLCWVLALAGLGGRIAQLPPDPSLLQRLPQPTRPPPERLGPFGQYAEIATRPLFSDDRRPKPFSLQPEGEGEQKNTFDYVLTSVLLTPRLKLAILQPTEGGESIRIKLGESAEQAASWRLATLDPRSAVFEGPEGQRTLELRAFDGTTGEAATPSQAGATRRSAQMPQAPSARQPVVEDASADAAEAAANAAANAASDAAAPAQVPEAAPAPANPDAPESQIDAIRKRIQARREQLRREATQTPPANNP